MSVELKYVLLKVNRDDEHNKKKKFDFITELVRKGRKSQGARHK